jgi:hypothetical protein
MFRVTNWISIFNSGLDKVFRNAVAYSKQKGLDIFNFEDEKIEITNKTHTELFNNYAKKTREAQVITQLVVALRLVKIRMKDNIRVIKVDHESNFINSDNPIIITKAGGKHFMPFDPDNLLSLPLNEKYKITLYQNANIFLPNYIGRILHKGEMASREIQVNNFYQYKMAERFIIGNKATLSNFEDFLDRCRNPINHCNQKKG